MVVSLISSSEPGKTTAGGTDSASDCVLIPGGEFLMGADTGGDHGPVHKVRVDSFYMDMHEVTNAQYYKFCQETERKLPIFWGMEKFRCGLNYPNHPVVGVSWSEAKAYAEWRGKRLPTEAEWEYAARGGLVGKKFSNGDTVDSTMANYSSEGTVPVGSYPPNGYGLYDMVGNVREWVSDWYDANYYSSGPYENPKGPEEGKFHVVRGGGWFSGAYCNAVYLRLALPGSWWVDFNVGFRCARDLR
jgi:iron(II)-dependent oxidoreductase